jgi:hypothetical protein
MSTPGVIQIYMYICMHLKARKHTVRFKMINAVMFSYLHLIAHFQYAHCMQSTQLNVNNVQYYVFVVYYCVFPI